MVTGKECLDFSGLTEGEIEAIAEHEHIPPILAAELGGCLLKSDVGTWLIKRYIEEDLQHAEQIGDEIHAAELFDVLAHFARQHPTYTLR